MKKSICFIFVLVSLSLSSQSWVQHEDIPTDPLFYSTSFVLDGFAYMLGGDNGTETADCWRYDAENDTWSLIASLPKALTAAAGFSLEGKGYVVGGYSGAPLLHSNDVYEYDPSANSWTQKNDFPATARYGMFTFSIGNEVFVGCGNSGTANGPYHHDCYKYIPDTDTWEQQEDFPGANRYACRGFSFDGKGYVIGGNVQQGVQSSELWAYDPITSNWEQKAPFPLNAARQSILPMEESVLALSGQNQANVVYEYYPELDTWFSRPDYPGGSGKGSIYFQVNGRSFIASGLDDQLEYQNDVWEYVGKIPSGVNDLTEIQFNIHPNPMTDVMTLNTSDVQGQLQMEIFDMSGRLIRTEIENLENGSLDIPRGNLATGNYILRITAQGQSYEFRIGVE